MGTVRSLFHSDPRIHATCLDFFPNSPEFVKYLSDRISALEGSMELALLLCRTLRAQCAVLQPVVPAECVERLGLDADEIAVGRINTAHPIGHRQVGLNTMVFLQQIDGILSVPAQFESLDTLEVTARKPVDNSPDKKVAYVRLFSCASAMLAGVAIDPRAQAA